MRAGRSIVMVLADILAAGGATLDGSTLAPVAPTSGYAVGMLPGTAVTLDAATVTDAAIRAALARIVTAYDAPYVGAWVEGGRIHLDPVEIVTRRAAALTLGRLRMQLAIYDFAAGESVEVAP
jgi:hypothetical protein